LIGDNRLGVEKLDFSEIRGNLGDRKFLTERKKSFVGHPGAIQFLRISGRRVFQQPQAFTIRTLVVGEIAMLRQQPLLNSANSTAFIDLPTLPP
jgi:hypothetical protein